MDTITRGKVSTPAPSETQLAYLAGVMDGEGYINLIIIRKSKTAKGGVPLYFRPTVGIAGTSPDLVEPFAELFGGAVQADKRTTISGKPVWTWRVFGNRAQEVCRQLLPYLVVKKRLAELLLSMEFKSIGKRRLPLEVFEQRVAVLREMRMIVNSGRPLDEDRIEELRACYHPQRLSEEDPAA